MAVDHLGNIVWICPVLPGTSADVKIWDTVITGAGTGAGLPAIHTQVVRDQVCLAQWRAREKVPGVETWACTVPPTPPVAPFLDTDIHPRVVVFQESVERLDECLDTSLEELHGRVSEPRGVGSITERRQKPQSHGACLPVLL